MVIGIFGESCVGKSTLADSLQKRCGAEIYTGKDYLRLAKNEAAAKRQFMQMLEDAVSGMHIIYVISEKEHLSLLPDAALRILVTADLGVIEKRFAERMGGKLPEPVKAMLERKHGTFDSEKCDIHVTDGTETINTVCERIEAMLVDGEERPSASLQRS